jgi:hypothetical protein
MFYIGSTSLDKINSGYIGSVKSRKYKDIFLHEKKYNKHLFKVSIVKKFSSREQALECELKLQQKLNVVRSSMYINKSLARDFGWYGMDNKKENSPVYGKRWKKTPEDKLNISKMQKIKWADSAYRNSMSKMRKGKYHRPKEIIIAQQRRKTKIIDLYNTKPELCHGYKCKNGKIMTYDQAYALKFSSTFEVTPQAIRNIINEWNTSNK